MRYHGMTAATGLAVCCALLLMATAAVAADEMKGDPYPLGTCPVTGEKLGAMGSPIVKVYDGREIRFCCGGCPAKFEADKASYLAKIDKEIAKAQTANYPMDTCVVTGNKLGAGAVNFVQDNRLFRLCSDGCKTEVAKDPAKYVAMLDKAVVAAQKDKYPLDTCVVSGAKLDSKGTATDYVMGNRLVRFCCPACIATFKQDPAKYLSMLDKETERDKTSPKTDTGQKEPSNTR